MALETGSVVNDLVTTNPAASDAKSQGDDHLRLIKSALKNSFPGFTGAVLAAGTSTGTANAYVLSASLPSYTSNTVVVFTPNVANTTASTININGLGLVYIKRVDGTDLQLNDLLVGQYAVMTYTGTEFRLLGATKGYIDNLAFNTALPAQTGNAGKLLTTDGITASWNGLLANLALKGANSDITSLNALSSINGGQLAGLRNRIINGACTVQQRGSVSNSAGSQYGGPDRFLSVNYPTSGVFTQSAATITYGGIVKQSVRQTMTTGKASFTGTDAYFGLAQLIEGYNCYDMLGKFATISFIFNTNLSGTYSVTIRDGSGVNSYTSTFVAVANTPLKVTLSLSAVIPVGAGIPNTNALGLSVYVGALTSAAASTSTLNSWITPACIMASTATNWAATAGNFIELTEFQLEIGSVATPFEQRPIGMELALCQRYYQKFTGVVSSGNTASGNGVYTGLLFPVELRAVPTMAYSNFVNSNAGNAATNQVTTKCWITGITITSTGYGYSNFTAETTGTEL